MRILLLNPPYAASEPPRIPMGLLYVAAVLLEAGHDVKVLDLLVSPPTEERIREAVEQFDPALVGATSVTMNYPDTSGLLKYIKEIHPSVKTVVGGPHATFCWEQIGREEPWIDMVARGEGEMTARELAAALDNGGRLGDIPGLAWRNGYERGMTYNGDRELVSDLDSLPTPARHLFPLSRYRVLRMDAGLTTGRGCPFNCAFCVGPKMVGRKPRLRSPELVVDEMEELLKMGFDNIALSDDHFAMHRKHAFAVCDEIIDRGLNADLSIFIRADSADENILSKMYEAGCRKILFGVESGSQEIVDAIRKRQNLEMVREKVALAKSMGIDVQASFILGLPGESRETVKRTFEFARSLETFFGMHILAPLPGSDIYEKADEYGIAIHHRDWRRYDANQAVTSTANLKASELNEIAAHYDDIFERLAQWEMKNYINGKLPEKDRKRVERRRAQAFFWKLLRDGVIENYRPADGPATPEDALRALIDHCAEYVGADAEESHKWLEEAFRSGDIKWQNEGGSGRFEFSDAVYVNGPC